MDNEFRIEVELDDDEHGYSTGERLRALDLDDEAQERQLNLHLEPVHLAGSYANFANISFSDYEFTLTFARIDHEVEEGDVPGVVVSRINMAPQFARELIDAMQDAWSRYTTAQGIKNLPETNDHS